MKLNLLKQLLKLHRLYEIISCSLGYHLERNVEYTKMYGFHLAYECECKACGRTFVKVYM